MRTITKEEAMYEKLELFMEIEKGALFIYPTDTIYGLGCNALDQKAVQKIRELKKRQDDPFSIIAPSQQWIYNNCIVTKEAEKWIKKLPGPYTLILPLKNKNCVAKNINPKHNSLGVRIPAHWFTKLINEYGKPIVTTSANQVGQEFMTSIDNLDPEISKGVSFVIYEGEKRGRPSQIVHLETEETKIKVR